MPLIWLDDLRLNARLSGPPGAPALVLIHGLGLSSALFDGLLPLLPPRLQVLVFDQRGHGLSDVPPAPYAMGQLIRDAERVILHFGLKDTVVLGHSMGGLVAQGLATKRLDLVRGLILSNTAARIGIDGQWRERIARVRRDGLPAQREAALQRWFGRGWRDAPGLAETAAAFDTAPVEGWCGGAAAIAGTDFYTPTAALRLPALAIAGANDGSTPPDLVRETAELIPGAEFRLIRGAGHLPFVEKPQDYAQIVTDFLTRIGHV